MKRKNHWLLFAILLLALINLSPSEETALVRSEDRGEAQPVSPPEQETLQEPGHIRVAVQMDESDFLQLEQMNREFMDNHRIEVDLVNVPPEETFASFQRRLLKLGESPDVLLLDNVWIRRFAADGYLLPTEVYYSGSLSGEVLSVSLVPNEWNGYVWGVPLDIDPYVYVYDASRLKQLGLKHPPASAEEWNALLTAYKKQPLTPYLLGLDYGDPYAALTLLWQLGGGGQTGGAASPFALTGEMQTALQQLEQIRPSLLHPQSSEKTAAEMWDKFYSGELALILTTASEAKKHQNPRATIWFPEMKPSHPTAWISGRSYAVSSQTENAEAAGQWIAAMTSSLNQPQWYAATGFLPVLKTIYYEAAKNDLPAWVPASLAAGTGAALPAGSELPGQLAEFAQLSDDYLRGSISAKQYRSSLAKIGK